jgi:hypothetical protein
MTATNLFGGLIDGSDVEAALLAHLEKWADTYVAQVRRVKDPEGELWPSGVSPVRDYTVRHASADNWPADQLPMLLAHCPNDGGKPSASGNGKVQAKFAVALSAIASGYDMADAKALARLYGSAANMAILQHEDLGEFAAGVEWAGFENMRITRGVEAERSLMAVANMYVITVDAVLDRNAGPREPLEDPDTDPGDWPTVKEGGASLRVEQGADKVALLRAGDFFDEE